MAYLSPMINTQTNSSTFYLLFEDSTSGPMIPRTDSNLTYIPTADLLGVGGITVTNTSTVINLNADMLDGQHSSNFATSTHNHNGTYEPYIGIPSIATNAGKVLTVNPTNSALIWSSASGTGSYIDVDSLGVVKSYFAVTPPDGWLWTQGQAISRTTYSDLFVAIGTTYGSGDGSTTFNIPNIGTNYIIKASGSGNTGIVQNPVSYTIGNYKQQSINLVQGAAGTTEIINFSATSYSSAELLLQIKQGTNFEVIKVLLITNNTDIYLEQYGRTGAYTNATINASLSSPTVSITITTTTTAATVKGSITLIAI